jgi:hypothetical protein
MTTPPPRGHARARLGADTGAGATGKREPAMLDRRCGVADVVLMTKMSWNSARFAEKLPVTVRFANEIGTILRDPHDYVPEARYAFYM